MKVLVAGGTGHLGSRLVPLLIRRQAEVRILGRRPDAARHGVAPAAEYVAGDVREMPSLSAALGAVEVVISAITGFGPGGPGPKAVDFQGNVNLIRASEQAGVRRYVFVSMQGAAADAPMELLRMKHRVELALRASRLEWVIIRPTVFMELWAGIVGDPIVRRGKTTVFGHGNNPVNFNSETDVARFVELATFDDAMCRTSLDIGGPDNITFNELVRQIECVAGSKAVVRHVPVPLMKISRLLMRAIRPDVAGMVEAGIALDTADMRFDPSELRRRFPQIELTPMASVIGDRFGQHVGDDVNAAITGQR